MAMVRNVAIFLAFAAMLMTVANATNYSITWKAGYDYAAWASANTFYAGDTILLTYTKYHDVYEVDIYGYSACSTIDPIFFDNSGSTTFILDTVGTVYIICGQPGHCDQGMKLEIDVNDPPSPDQSPPPPASISPPPPGAISPPIPAEISPPPPGATKRFPYASNSPHRMSSGSSFALASALMMLASI